MQKIAGDVGGLDRAALFVAYKSKDEGGYKIIYHTASLERSTVDNTSPTMSKHVV